MGNTQVEHDSSNRLLKVMTHTDWAFYFEASRRLIINKVIELKENGTITEKVADEIITADGQWFIENYPHLLPSS